MMYNIILYIAAKNGDGTILYTVIMHHDRFIIFRMCQSCQCVKNDKMHVYVITCIFLL